MSTPSHIQSSGLRRSAAAVAIVAAALTLAGQVPAASSKNVRHGTSHVRPMPGGGCNAGCRPQLLT
jgi:hypothetical protein